MNHVSVYSLHPGVVATELGRNFQVHMYGLDRLWNMFSSALFLSPKQGAQTTLYCALSDDIESGQYYRYYILFLFRLCIRFYLHFCSKIYVYTLIPHVSGFMGHPVYVYITYKIFCIYVLFVRISFYLFT